MIENEPTLSVYAERVEEIEVELLTLAAELELAGAVGSLTRYPEWEQMRDRLMTLRNNVIEKLLNNKMGQFELGRRQGIARAILAVISTNELTEQEVDERQGRITILKRELAEFRSLIE